MPFPKKRKGYARGTFALTAFYTPKSEGVNLLLQYLIILINSSVHYALQTFMWKAI